MQLAILTTDDAPAGSRAVLDGIAADLGLVPNLAAATAASPALLAGFDGLRRAVASAKLDPVLREITGTAHGCGGRQQQQTPASEARDPAFQDQLMDRLAALTSVGLFWRARAVPRAVAGGAACGTAQSRNAARMGLTWSAASRGAPWPRPGSSVYWQSGMR